MASDVIVKITQKSAPKKLGFGIPLLLSSLETREIPYTECGGIDEIKALFAEETDVYKAAKLLLMQEDAPAKVAIYGSTKKATEALSDIWKEGFRQIIVTSLDKESEDALKIIAEYVETKGDKMLFATVHTTDNLTLLANSKMERTVAFYHTDEIEAAAALVGATAAKAAGSITYKNTVLKSINPLNLTDAEIEGIHSKGAITFVTKAGDNVTTEGTALSGEFIDVVDSQDYVVQQIEYQLQKTLNSQPKVPYDNKGIALLESVVVNVMQGAYKNGIIAEKEDGTPDYSVTFQKRTDTDPSDRVERKYIGGSFSFGLAGAVHKVEITGEIII